MFEYTELLYLKSMSWPILLSPWKTFNGVRKQRTAYLVLIDGKYHWTGFGIVDETKLTTASHVAHGSSIFR